MLNILKGEFYKLSKNKNMQLLGGVLVIGIIISFLLFKNQTNESLFESKYINVPNINIEELKKEFNKPINLERISPEMLAASHLGIIAINIQAEEGIFNADAIDFFYSSDAIGIIEIFIISIIFSVFGSEVSSKSFKNIISYGISRSEYYLAKFLSIAIIVFIGLFFIMFGQFLLAYIFIGVNEPLTEFEFFEMTMKFLSAYLAYLSIVSISMMIAVFTDGNSDIFVGSLIFLFVLGPIILAMFGRNIAFYNIYNFLMYLTPKFNVLISTTHLSTSVDVIGSMAISSLTIITSIVFGKYAFDKKDFKL